jgi:hypothetical protein
VSSLRALRQVSGALYTWSATVFFGAVLLDVVYASLLGAVDESITQPVFGEVSDLLLMVGHSRCLPAWPRWHSPGMGRWRGISLR